MKDGNLHLKRLRNYLVIPRAKIKSEKVGRVSRRRQWFVVACTWTAGCPAHVHVSHRTRVAPGRNASSARVRRGLLRASRILEKERRTRTRERRGERRHEAKKERGRSSHMTLARSSTTESSRPNLTYPRWDLSIGFTCHGLYRYLPYCLPLPIYQESPHRYFPFPRTDHPVPAAHSYESRISSFSVRRVRVPLKVTGKIFGATITPCGC